MCCSFCRSNGEDPSIYESHKLKDENGKVTCPVLMNYQCPTCQAIGEHTRSYCPRNKSKQAAKAADKGSVNLGSLETGNRVAKRKSSGSSAGFNDGANTPLTVPSINNANMSKGRNAKHRAKDSNAKCDDKQAAGGHQRVASKGSSMNYKRIVARNNAASNNIKTRAREHRAPPSYCAADGGSSTSQTRRFHQQEHQLSPEDYYFLAFYMNHINHMLTRCQLT